MTKLITQQLIVHDANGLPKGMLVEVATYDDAGKFVSKASHELIVAASQSIAELSSQIIALEQAKTQVEASLDTANQTIATKQAEIHSLESQLASLPTLQATIAELQAKVDALLPYRPFDPNVIRSKSFYDRITGDERFALGVLAMTDENAKGILSLLSDYVVNKWKVVLDDPQVTGAIGYLAGSGVLTSGRVSEITRPGIRDEAYVA